MPSMLPPLDWQTLTHAWHARPGWTAVAILAVSGYVAALVVCCRHQVRSVPAVRVAAFVTGWALLVATVSSAIDVYAMAVFWDHMVEHLLLIMVVPALIVVGHPLTVLRAAAAARGREQSVDRFLQRGPVAVLTHPAFGVAAYAVVIVATHLTSFMDAMATHPWLMTFEQAIYVTSGYLFLLGLIGNEPVRWRLSHLARVALVLLAMTPDTVVGLVLLQTSTDLFPTMEGMHPAWAPAPVADLNIAGGLMWAAGDGIMMVLGVGVVVAMIADPSREAVLGPRLEGVRRRTLTAQLSRHAGDDTTREDLAEDIDVDDDDAMLEAYNRMLARWNDHPEP